MTWVIEGTQIKTQNGNVVTLAYNVKESIQVGEVLVVLLDVPPNQSMTENVFGLSHDGTVLWQIERTSATATDPFNCYVGVIASSDNTVRVANWNGMVSDINVKTGRVIQSRWMK